MSQQVRSVTGQIFPIAKEYQAIVGENARDANKYCKVCGNLGTRVLQVTVATHTEPGHWNLLSEGFWFSHTPDCPIIYFNNRTGIYFAKDEVKTRFGLKETEDPRPICYCLAILEEHIRYEILRKGCCDSLNDIVGYTKAGTGKWCLTTNPSGKCCREYLKGIVDKYLSMKDAKPVHSQLQAVKTTLEGEERPTRKLAMSVYGMTCKSCAIAVSTSLEKVGGKNVKVSFKDGTAELTTSGDVQTEDAVRAVTDLGYDAKVLKSERL